MTSPDHLLSLAEWDALSEDVARHAELVEGVVLMAPRPAALHQRAVLRLAVVVEAHLPSDASALPDVSVLMSDGLTVRAPDLIVVPSDLAAANPVRFDGSDVELAVEIVSPGTRRTDHVMKLAECAAAQIPHYWVLDLDPVVSITVHSAPRPDGTGYAETGTFTADQGTVTIGGPRETRISLSLDGLTRR